MVNFLPPSDVSTTEALLIVLSNPDKYQKLLYDLVTKENQAVEKIKESEVIFDNIRKSEQDLEAKKNDAALVLSKAEDTQKRLQDQRDQLSNLADSLSDLEKKLASRESLIINKEADLNRRETSLAAKEQDVSNKQSKAETLLSDYNSKLEKLRQLTGN